MTLKSSVTVAQRKHRSWSCINIYIPVTDTLSGMRKQSTTQSPFLQPTIYILRYSSCVERNKSHHVHVPLPTWSLPSNHNNFPPPKLNHQSLVQYYVHAFYSRVKGCLAKNLILIIKSYRDNDNRYTSALLLHQLITQTQWCLNRVGDFSLITKLERKHKNVQLIVLTIH